MTEFTYNTANNTNISYTLFKHNYEYHFRVLFEDETDLRSRSCSANKLAKQLKKLMEIYY